MAVANEQEILSLVRDRLVGPLEPLIRQCQANVIRGNGSPEGAVEAVKGTLYLRTDGGIGTTFYVKEAGTGNTGWAAK